MLKRIVMVLVACTVAIGGLMFSGAPARAGSMNAPVLLIHGWNANSVQDCDTGTM